jgi:hypothetical protein
MMSKDPPPMLCVFCGKETKERYNTTALCDECKMKEKCPNCGKSDCVKCIDFKEGSYDIYLCERCWGTWSVVHCQK